MDIFFVWIWLVDYNMKITLILCETKCRSKDIFKHSFGVKQQLSDFTDCMWIAAIHEVVQEADDGTSLSAINVSIVSFYGPTIN